MEPLLIAILAGLVVKKVSGERVQAQVAPVTDDPASAKQTTFDIAGLQQPNVALGLIETAPAFEAKTAHLAAIAYLNTLRRLMLEDDLASLPSVQNDLKTKVDLSDAASALLTGAKVAKATAALGPIASPAIGASVGFVSWIAEAVKAANNFSQVKTDNDRLQRWWTVARSRVGAPPRSLFHFLTGVQLLDGRVIRHGLENPFDAVKWTAIVLSAIDFCTQAGVNWQNSPYWYPAQAAQARATRALPLIDNDGYFYRAGYNNPGFVDKSGRRYRGFYWNYALLYDFLLADCSSSNVSDGQALKLTTQQVKAAYVSAYKRRPRSFEELALFSNGDNAAFVQTLLDQFGKSDLRYDTPSINCFIGRRYGRGIREDGGWNSRIIIETQGRGQMPATLVSDTSN